MNDRFIAVFASISLLLAVSQRSDAQIMLKGVNQDVVNPVLLDGSRWSASWIQYPGTDQNYGVYHFRKSFELPSKPDSFIINVSADNRYKLYVNGELVSLGPAKGDVFNWNFETVDIAPYLKSGSNIMAALVWNAAEFRPVAIMSHGKTGLLVQGNTDKEKIVNTNGTWLCYKDCAFTPASVSVAGYYAAGSTDNMDGRLYPWGWEQAGFDDSSWVKAVGINAAAPKGSQDYPDWQLVPRSIPQMERLPMRFSSVRKATGVSLPSSFPASKAAFTVPAHTQAEILLDNGVLTTGYTNLAYSGGKDAVISMGYAEALYADASTRDKANRSEVDGKTFIGYYDTVTADGGEGRVYEPLWWRTWRYVKLTVKTENEPLTIDDLSAFSSMYPFTLASSFEADGHPEYQQMIEMGWRTARLCAHETYMDCPYYEQLQYFGDARIQAMVTMYNTNDAWMVKHLIEQGRQSICPDGITQSRYPGLIHQYIPTFSLFWISTIHDYWMMRGDEEYCRTLIPAMRGILSWFQGYLGSDMCLRNLPYWIFGDWCGPSGGVFPKGKDGRSAFIDQVLIMALQDAAEMEHSFGEEYMSEKYASLEAKMRSAFKNNYWDAKKNIFADNGDFSSYSQHVNVLSILTETVTGKEASDLFLRTLENKDILQCTIYFRYYLQQAMKLSGNGNMLLDNLQLLENQMAVGLTTVAEMPEPSRSDCHAWGASMNIEFFRTVLGIDSAAPGFKMVSIEPYLGKLTKAKGTMPHPKGEISVSYELGEKGKIKAEISLPEGVSGTFEWGGKFISLHPGHQTLTL